MQHLPARRGKSRGRTRTIAKARELQDVPTLPAIGTPYEPTAHLITAAKCRGFSVGVAISRCGHN